MSAGTKGLSYSVHSSGRSEVTKGFPDESDSHIQSHFRQEDNTKLLHIKEKNKLARQQREIEKMFEFRDRE